MLFICSDFEVKLCQWPYHVEHTSSRPITEVKQHWARIVLGSETAWELQVLLAFSKSGCVVGGKMTRSQLSLTVFASFCSIR